MDIHATPCVLMDVMDFKKNIRRSCSLRAAVEGGEVRFCRSNDPKRGRGRLRKIPDFYFEPILCEYCLPHGSVILSSVLSSVKSKVNVQQGPSFIFTEL